MGIVSTTDKQEALETGKIYLCKKFFYEISKLKINKINRCEYCRRVINKNNDYNNEIHYCDMWCREAGKRYEKEIKKIQNK